MLKRFYLAVLLLSSLPLLAQRTGSWRDHFAYTQGVDVMPAQAQVLCATSAGLLFFDGELTKVSKVDGLNDFGITAAMYDAQTQRIFLGYDNGNIDILNSIDPYKIKRGGQSKNISTWKTSSKVGAKRINRFLRVDGKIFVATASRILEISGDEVVSDFTINETGDTLAVRDLALLGSTIVAATSKGLYTMDKSNPQLYFYGSWQRRLAGSGVVSLAVNGTSLYALQSSGVLQVTSDLQSFSAQGTFPNPRALSVAGGELWLSAAATLYNVSNPQKNITSYGSAFSTFSPYRVGVYNSKIYVADLGLGLMLGDGSSFTQVVPNGPQQNQVSVLDERSGKVVAAGASSLSVLENKSTWISTTSGQISDPQSVKINVQNAAEIFVSTSSGVAKFSNTVFAKKDLQGSNVKGMDFDRNGSLFAFASSSAKPVNTYAPDGSWLSLSNADLQNKSLGKAVAAGRVFWGIFGANQIYVYGPGNSASDASDDNASTFPVQLNVGEFNIGSIYALAVDRNNEVWMGTDKGVALYNSTGDPFTTAPKAQRVKIPTEIPGYAAYLLEYERVTAIAVDGGNRKWFGTRDAGVFLQSEDGSEQLQMFNMQNSPLPSNNIVDIAVNSQTGEVIFATDKGMVGYYGDAIGGKENFDEVKIFPNPVRPGMNLVTITNLMEDASVRITDVSGNLVFFATANGGAITWDARNLNGNRVATGVYLVFLADPSGQESRVVKLLVVN